MKFRLISKNGDGLALAYRIDEEGHKVDYWVKMAQAKEGYRGILPQREHWNNRLGLDTVCIFDMVGFGGIADNLKGGKFHVYGGGKLNDALELNREFAMKTAKSYGLKVPKYEQFKSFKKAKDFVSENGGRWVFKPENNQTPAFTYLSTDTEDMVEMLDYFEGIWENKVDFLLQEYVTGVELSVEGWYKNGLLIPGSLNSTLEQKRFLEDDRGAQTGCMGSVVRFWREKQPKIYRLTLKKLESFLRRFKYSGALDCNTIISEKEQLPYFLEFTARFGYNALYAACEGLRGKISTLMADLANPDDAGPVMRASGEWLGAVRVSIPPYPQEQGALKSANKPVRGVDDLAHTWLLDVKYEKGRMLSAGVDGVICEITGRNKTLDGLEKDIYDRIGRLKIPDMQFRGDIISKARRKIRKLQQWRYL